MEFVLFLIQCYRWMVIAAVLVSWINLTDDNPIVSLLHTFVEPPLSFIRRWIPDTGGLDFSPMVLIFMLYGLESMLIRSVYF